MHYHLHGIRELGLMLPENNCVCIYIAVLVSRTVSHKDGFVSTERPFCEWRLFLEGKIFI